MRPASSSYDRLVVQHELAALERAAAGRASKSSRSTRRGASRASNTCASSSPRPWPCTSRGRRCGASRRIRRRWSRTRYRCSRSPTPAATRARPGPADVGDDPFGNGRRLVGVAELVHQHRELVAAEPGRGVARRAGSSTAARSTITSSASPAEWPRLSFTVLKSSRSRNSTASWPPSRWSRVRRVVDAVTEQRLVGETGQRVVERLVRQLVLQPAVVGDVTEAPHAADDLTVDALRQRVAVEDPAVLELERVVADGFRLVVQAADLGDERGRVAELVEHERERVAVVGVAEDLGRQLPHLGEPAVGARDPARSVDHENAVGGRLERRREHRVGGAQVGLHGHPVADVVPGRDESLHGRVVEQVGEGQRERNARARRVPQAQVDGHRRGRRRAAAAARSARFAARLRAPAGRALRPRRRAAGPPAIPGRCRAVA